MTKQMPYQPMSALYTTVSTLDEAKFLARQAIEAKVAFCVNIVPHGVSIYHWEDEVHEENECYLLFKTLKEMRALLVTWITDNHPYATPVIIDAEVMVNPAYMHSMKQGIK